MTETKDYYPTRGKEEKIIDRVDPVLFDNGDCKGKHSLDKSYLKSYGENGFILFPAYFPKNEVESFLSELERLKRSDKLKKREELITEPDNSGIRSIFNPHKFSELFDRLSRDSRILDKVRQILGGDVYIHHSRINIKRGLHGKAFPWHSDFETWHAEDGLPRSRCLTAWVMLTENSEFNGPLYLIPGSHKKYVSCAGKTPDSHYNDSLRKQEYGSPSMSAIEQLARESKMVGAYGKPGTLVFNEGNIMHGSPDNISHMPRTNIFFVYNSVYNTPAEKPFGADKFRPLFLGSRDFTPLEPFDNYIN